MARDWPLDAIGNKCRQRVAIVLTIVAACFMGTARADDDPFEDLRQRIERLERLQMEAADNAVIPPAPGDDDMTAQAESTVPPLEETTQLRLSNLESALGNLNERLQLGTLNPTIPRSTDISPLVPTNKAPTYPSVKVTGFFQLDAGFFNQDAANQTQFGTVKNDLGFRRARLAAVGDVSKSVSYMFEMDFAFPGRPSFMDVWLDVHDVPILGNVKVGQWRQPFGMDELTSVRELTFLERPLMFALAPFRETGIGFHDNNEEQTLTWAGSVFGFPTDAQGDVFGNKGIGTAERLTYLAQHENDGRDVLHFGIDHSFNVPGHNGVIYRNNAEYGGPFGGGSTASTPGQANSGPLGTNGITGDIPFFTNSGILFYDNANLLNLEFAGVRDSFHWQSEARFAFLNFAGRNVTVPAYYAQVAYLLTGEVRPYNKAAGVLGRIKPLRPWGECGGLGAWELAARYSYIDMNPVAPFSVPQELSASVPIGSPAIPFGGALNDVTLGVNWYLNTYTKFQFNYIYSDIYRGGINSNLNTLCMRAQLDF